MAIIKGTSVTTSELLSTVTQPGQRLISVRVIDIILSEFHDKFEEFGNYDSIGTIFYTKIEDDTPLESEKYASSAKPLFSFIKSYPLINEIVLIVSANDKTLYNTPNSITNYYLPNINIWNSPHHNALPTIKNLKETTSIRDYENTQNSIIRQPTDTSTDINLGDYFNEQLNIKSLLPYEGDNIIEGRFGNSIRFGSTTFNNNPWSLTGSIGDPITIIRNGQDKNLTTGWIPIVEDINNDNSSLYMTSTQQLSNFIPASTNQKSFRANFVAPVPIEVQFTQVPANTVVIEPTPTPISNEEFLTDESEPYVPNIQPTPTSSNPISNDPFGDYEAEVLEAGGDVGFYEVEKETDNNEITPQSEDLIPIDPDDNPIPVVIPSGSDEGTTTEDVLTELGPYGVFTLNDLIYSNTAIANNINNLPGRDLNKSYDYITNNLKNLAINILTPLHEKYGDNMVITSCYRCNELDKHPGIGGGGDGEHTRGAAADIQVKNVPTSEIFNYIKNNFETWRCMIWEHPERGTNPKSRASWVHIAYEEKYKLTEANGNYKGLKLKTDNPDISKYYRERGGIAKSDNRYTDWSPNQGDWTNANQDLIT